MHRGIATFTLDEGRCPRWLFERMVKLGREIVDILIQEMGPYEFVKRMGDPVWFQSLGTVLAFDWNASGLTTILTAALKEAIRGREKELGVFICGGKGKTSRKTPEEIQTWGEQLSLSDGVVSNLVYNSKMAAKVDSALVQDGYQIYHHAFFFAFSKQKRLKPEGKIDRLNSQIHAWPNDNLQISWTVVQQGMRPEDATARRYHWHSEKITDLVCEPHSGIVSDTLFKLESSERKSRATLNLVAKESEMTRSLSVEMVKAGYRSLMKDIQVIRRHISHLSQMAAVAASRGNRERELFAVLNLEPIEFRYHPVLEEDLSRSKYLEKILSRVTEEKPENYEKLVAIPGVGPKTVRALALVGEVIYGAEPSYRDPARYSFAFGGKDATPYPVDRKTYDSAIAILKLAVQKTQLENNEKRKILARLESKQGP